MRQINFIILTQLSALIVLNHLHECFNILGHSIPSSREASQCPVRVPTSFDWLLNYKKISTKTLIGCKYLLPTKDSPMELSEALTRLQARSVLKIFTPNVTRKMNSISLMTQLNVYFLP